MRWEGDKGGRAPCASTWTAEKDAVLCRLWPDRDLSCPQIAVEIGGGATKNSVIGRARRLKLGPKPRSSEAKQCGQADGAATKRARSERERVVSGHALAERRERQAAIGRATIAKVEAQQARVRRQGPHSHASVMGTTKGFIHSIDGVESVDVPELPPERFRPVVASDNPAFVTRVEKPWDPYSHLRTERGYHDAIAALSR